jgi:hypothetical protein
MGNPVDNAVRPCPACESGETSVFLDFGQVPVFCNVHLPTREAAKAVDRASIRLAFCRQCAFIYNADFDSARVRYTGSYDNSLQHSAQFRGHARRLTEYLIARYDLRNRQIIEIGCGDAGLLAMLCEAGNNHAVGFDPAYDPNKVASESRMHVIADVYGPKYAHLPVDFILCRQVLEHIAEPFEFLRMLRDVIGLRNVTLFFGVPSGEKMFNDLGLWDIIYEHCCYFTRPAIERLFIRAGFEPIRISTRYEGQYLDVEARPNRAIAYPAPDLGEALAEIEQLASHFGSRCRAKLAEHRQAIGSLAANGRRCVIWGCGAKGVTFLNLMRVPLDVIPFGIDINPNKHGRFLPGTGQEIMPPEFLREYQPDLVLVMNHFYLDEIRAAMRQLNVHAQVCSLDELPTEMESDALNSTA